MADTDKRQCVDSPTESRQANTTDSENILMTTESKEIDASNHSQNLNCSSLPSKMTNETESSMPPPASPASPGQAGKKEGTASQTGKSGPTGLSPSMHRPTAKSDSAEQPDSDSEKFILSKELIATTNKGKAGESEKVKDEGFIVPSFVIGPRPSPSSGSGNKHTFVKPTSTLQKTDAHTFKQSKSPKAKSSAVDIKPNIDSISKSRHSDDKDPDKGDIDVVKSIADAKNSGETQRTAEAAKIEKTGDSKFKQLSPAQKQKASDVPLPYLEPKWGGLCTQLYSFDVIKNGKEIDSIDLKTKSFHVFGRLPACDVSMEHPSLSRYHAVVQYCSQPDARHEEGWYLYDLDSTHGTWINKVQVKPRSFYRLRVGFIVKFGGSTRLHLLQGPSEDQEAESDLSVTEMKAERERRKKEAEEKKLADQIEKEQDEELSRKSMEEEGCAWGISEDAQEDEVVDMASNPFSLTEPQNEELYIDDPKKALKGYFEREGYDLPEYDLTEAGYGKHTCRVEVPLDSSPGQPLVAEVTITGKKKEAVVACALEACRLLDKAGLLRKATHESRKKKAKKWEDDDFYDSDDDTFLDRTGDIEKKRQVRMKRLGKQQQAAETYETLISKLSKVEEEMASVETELERAKAERETMQREEGSLDALDAYMSAIKSGAMDTKTKMKLKRQLFDLKQQQQQLRKLVNIAKPASLPELKKSPAVSKGPSPKPLPLFGKRKMLSKPSKPTPDLDLSSRTATVPHEKMNREEEEEEEEEETGDGKTAAKPAVTEKANIEEAVEAGKPRVLGPSMPPPTVLEESPEPQSQSPGASTDIEKTVVSQEVAPSSESQKQSNAAESCGPVHKEGGKEPRKDKDKDMEKESIEFQKETVKRKRQRPNRQQKSKKAKPESETSAYAADDPDYAVWMPPTDQSGDGRSRLNEKFGY